MSGTQGIRGDEAGVRKAPPQADRGAVLLIALDLEEERRLDRIALSVELVSAQEDEDAGHRPKLRRRSDRTFQAAD